MGDTLGREEGHEGRGLPDLHRRVRPLAPRLVATLDLVGVVTLQGRDGLRVAGFRPPERRLVAGGDVLYLWGSHSSGQAKAGDGGGQALAARRARAGSTRRKGRGPEHQGRAVPLRWQWLQP